MCLSKLRYFYPLHEISAQSSRAAKRQGKWARTGFRTAVLYAVRAGLAYQPNLGIAATRQYDLRSVVPGNQHSGADHNDPLTLHRFLGADVPAGQYGEELVPRNAVFWSRSRLCGDCI